MHWHKTTIARIYAQYYFFPPKSKFNPDKISRKKDHYVSIFIWNARQQVLFFWFLIKRVLTRSSFLIVLRRFLSQKVLKPNLRVFMSNKDVTVLVSCRIFLKAAHKIVCQMNSDHNESSFFYSYQHDFFGLRRYRNEHQTEEAIKINIADE